MQPHSHKHWRKRSKHHEISGALWMIGMGVLFITGWWWPGILILMGVVSVVSAMAGGWSWDGEPEPQPERKRTRPVEAAPPPSPFAPTQPATRVETVPPVVRPTPASASLRLPEFCPHCGAPTKALRHLAAQPDECAFCGGGLVK
ncbi:MAG: hypothetical protein JNL09_07780 [Anaerolineales bacterium]|nr:hypothetical protein [Anaerolineales bacterium]